MKIKRKNADQIAVLLDHYEKQIAAYADDVSKIAEVRAVKTLRDGVIQGLQAIEIDGLSVDGMKIGFDVDAAADDTEAKRKFRVTQFSRRRNTKEQSTPMNVRFTQRERKRIEDCAIEMKCKASDVIRSALACVGVLEE